MKVGVLFFILIIVFSYNINCSQKISVIGTGYVGLVTGACLSSFGHKVICADIDTSKIQKLNNNIIPIYEPGLTELIAKERQENRLLFTSDIPNAIKESDIIFIAVGTPMSADGSADLTALYAVLETIGHNINSPKIICIKSTVPIGTCKSIKPFLSKIINQKLIKVVFNPEFLREGSAVQDSLHPDRIIFGGSKKAINVLQDTFISLINKNVPVITTDLTTAEMIKYAANAFLAIKLSYINEMAQFCDKIKADCGVVAQGIGLDKRIGNLFLKPGPGYGGSCFPKDSQALLNSAKKNDMPLHILKASVKVNNKQIKYIFNQLLNLMDNNLHGKTVAVLGLAFKANTDDVRYSPAIPFIKNLQKHNCIIKAYDPIASENMKHEFPDIIYSTNIYDACKNADAVVILTEWPEFANVDLSLIKDLVKTPILLDTRNIISTEILDNLEFNYTNVGNCKVK